MRRAKALSLATAKSCSAYLHSAKLAAQSLEQLDMAPRPPVDYIERTKSLYSSLGHQPYAWVSNNGDYPWQPIAKPLGESKLGVVASGGIYRHGQVAFHHKDDISYRRIPVDTPIAELRPTHFAYDLTAARKDPNAVLPLDALNNLVASARIGALASNALTFMGGIYSSRKVRDVLAPAIVAELQKEEVDLALLIPV
jgi:D-proline reductase (dithiol) PrdB